MYRRIPEAKVYLPGAGRCIYCGSDGPYLGREHIIARKLGGKLVLHKASCRKCEGIINHEIETPALAQMWISPRTHLGLPSSKPKTTLQVGIWNDIVSGIPSDMSAPELGFRFREIPLSDMMFVIILPRFAPPGILTGREKSDGFTLTGLDTHFDGGNSLSPAKPGEKWGIFEKLEPHVLCRFLAKVAHGAAIAEIGFDQFDPFLPDVILGTNPFASHYVGSCGKFAPRKRDALHRVGLDLRGGFVTAEIQLFSKFGLPPYQVIVGRLRGELARLHRSRRMTVSAHEL